MTLTTTQGKALVQPIAANICVKCERGEHHLCWGYDGPMTTHPDSLPLCTCDHGEGQP